MYAFSIISILIGISLLLVRTYIAKNYNIISGYNNLTPAQKTEYGEAIASDTSLILLILGIFNISMSIVSVFFVSNSIFDQVILLYICGSLIIVTFFLLKRKSYPFMPIYISVPLGLLFISLIIIIPYMFIKSTKDPNIIIEKDHIKIESVYGQNISRKNIESVKLLSNRPNIKRRLKGFQMGNYAKGQFLMKNDTIEYLFLVNSTGPFINILTHNGENITINTSSPQITNMYFKNILDFYNISTTNVP